MKRFFILSLALIFATTLFAQKSINKNAKVGEMTRSALMKKSATSNLGPTVVPGQTILNSPVSKAIAAAGKDLVVSKYDLQSNSNVSNRAYRMEDGTMMFTATISNDEQHATRGSAYNYFNGTAWNDSVVAKNVETVRAGWPTVAPVGDGAILLNHFGSTTEIGVYTTADRANPTWENKGTLPGSSSYAWPRVAVTYDGSTEYIHAIASNQGDSTTILKYWRSTDGGTTWEGPSDLPGLTIEEDTRFVSDGITAVAKGSTIIFLYVDFAADIVYARSDDNGENFTAHYIYETVLDENFFYITTFVPGDTLSLYCPSIGYGALDNDGFFHVALNTSLVERTYETEPGYYTYYSGGGIDGIYYWNETMGQIPTDPSYVNNIGQGAKTVDSTFHMYKADSNGDVMVVGGLGGSVYGMFEEGSDTWPVVLEWSNEKFHSYRQCMGVSIFPVIAVDNDGAIIVAYSSFTKEGTTGGEPPKFFRRIYARQYDDETQQWEEEAINVTSDFTYGFSEVVFPTVAHGNLEGDFWDIFYSVDELPGLFLNGPGTDGDGQQLTATDNYYKHNPVLKAGHTPAIKDVQNVATFEMYPNPATSNVDILVENVSNIKIYNTVGQLVKTINNVQGKINVDVSAFATGVYLVNVCDESGVSHSQKLIVR